MIRHIQENICFNVVKSHGEKRNHSVHMTKIETSLNKVFNFIQKKNKLGFGISSPQAKNLEDVVKGLKEELAVAHVFPADWTAKYSIGKGNLASVMWIVFLPPGQTTQDGIYVAICFGKAGNGLVAGCSISNTSQKKYSPFVKTVDRGQSPVVDVDGTRRGTHYNNGYVNPLEIMAGAVDENAFLKHLKDSVPICLKAIADFDKTKGKAIIMPVDSKGQVITYGAPGTGKSHETKKEVAGKTWFRMTFHPDSDYASFVGTYKPTMKEDGVALTEVSQKDAAGQLVGTEIHDQRKGIAYEFVAQVFTKAYVEAWRRQKKAAAGATPEPVYLVIEEINRGNCAQVFGDIFQLLDRKPVGFSEYSIEPDADLGRFIGKEIAKETATIDAARKAQINALYPEATFDVVDEVLSGNRLLLPDNFFIRATMNTSDQSLFPMDSAFKRRWDWKYVPIKDAGKGWKIKFGDCERDWWKFLVAINKIVRGVTNSADKQMGYFFVKAKDSVIDAEMFVNKVAFYLWNDVFKDCELDGDAFKITREGGEVDVLAFQDFFREDGTINEEVLKSFLTKLVPQSEPENDAASQAGTGA